MRVVRLSLPAVIKLTLMTVGSRTGFGMAADGAVLLATTWRCGSSTADGADRVPIGAGRSPTGSRARRAAVAYGAEAVGGAGNCGAAAGAAAGVVIVPPCHGVQPAVGVGPTAGDSDVWLMNGGAAVATGGTGRCAGPATVAVVAAASVEYRIDGSDAGAGVGAVKSLGLGLVDVAADDRLRWAEDGDLAVHDSMMGHASSGPSQK